MKLLEHFKAMQAMCSRYVEPIGYVNREGVSVEGRSDIADHVKGEAMLFIDDMIYMLDGPEQRAAQEDAEAIERERNDHADWRMDIRKQVEQADEIAKMERHHRQAADRRVEELTVEGNDLRSRLFEAELQLAKARGYMERIEDEQPPVMVPHERERFLARFTDASMPSRSPGWAVHDSPLGSKPWYHR